MALVKKLNNPMVRKLTGINTIFNIGFKRGKTTDKIKTDLVYPSKPPLICNPCKI